MSKQVVGINPDILRWARERAGHSVDDVAAAIKKDAAIIEDWEAGISAPTYVQLEVLAYRLYKRPVALFFFPQVPKEPDPEKSFRTLPDVEIEEWAADTRHKIREALAIQLSLAELTGGKNPARRFILDDLSVTSMESARNTAQRVRAYLSVDVKEQIEHWKTIDDALKEWRTRLEDVGIFVFKDSFKQPEISGFCLYDSEFPLILVNNSTASTRQIFTLFHELAHLLVHVSGITKEDDSYIDLLSGESKQIEIFCNRFAAEFLLPAGDFSARLKHFGTDPDAVAEIARIFKVSREVILRRLLDMRLITKQRYEANVKKFNEEYKKAVESRPSGGNYYATQATYLSERYAKLAFSNYYRGSISVDQLAEYLNISVKSVAGLEPFILQKTS
jgi:Zn-dependent peptidase ImmA (M78 family)/transcriptional regulator with XRE-family HTH domain